MTFKILLAFFGIILSTTLLTILTAIDFQKNNILSVGKNHINGRFHMMARGDTAMVNQNELVVFDFAKTSDREQWRPINDTVMGGISKSRLQLTKDENALFTGNVSLENSGGFASLQSKPSNHDFSGYEGIPHLLHPVAELEHGSDLYLVDERDICQICWISGWCNLRLGDPGGG